MGRRGRGSGTRSARVWRPGSTARDALGSGPYRHDLLQMVVHSHTRSGSGAALRTVGVLWKSAKRWE